MRKELYRVEGPWRGQLSLAARPRGGDWLQDDLSNWKRAKIDIVVSLLTPDEEQEMGLRQEQEEAKNLGMEFYAFPIPDRQVPKSEAKWADILERVTRDLTDGKNLVVHCRQGIGRSGLVAACLLVRKGMSPGAAVDLVSTARGVSVPETPEQRDWIDHYAVGLTATK